MPNWVIIQNDSGEVIEGNSLVRVTGVDSDGNFIVDKPNRDGQTDLFISGPGSIPDGSYGQAHNEFPAVVKYDTANETNAAPADGEIWGAKAGSWKLTRKMPGFRILGSGVQEKCIIARATTSLIVFVYVTSATASSGRYPATEKFFDPVAGTWSDGDAVWYNDANGAVPTVNTYHQAMLVGFANGRKCYREAVVGGSSSLTVKEADGTPSYGGITSLEFNQADGFEVTQPAAGRANVNLKDAAFNQNGIVNLDEQWLGDALKKVTSLGIGTNTGTSDPADDTIGAFLVPFGATGIYVNGLQSTSNYSEKRFLLVNGEFFIMSNFADTDSTSTTVRYITDDANDFGSLQFRVRANTGLFHMVDLGSGGSVSWLTGNGLLCADEVMTPTGYSIGNDSSTRQQGATGSFTTVDGKTVTATGGIITSIV